MTTRIQRAPERPRLSPVDHHRQALQVLAQVGGLRQEPAADWLQAALAQLEEGSRQKPAADRRQALAQVEAVEPSSARISRARLSMDRDRTLEPTRSYNASRGAGRCFVSRPISPSGVHAVGMDVENLKITEVPPGRFWQIIHVRLARLRQSHRCQARPIVADRWLRPRRVGCLHTGCPYSTCPHRGRPSRSGWMQFGRREETAAHRRLLWLLKQDDPPSSEWKVARRSCRVELPIFQKL